MMEDVHIADGIAIELLLVGIVLAAGVVGALGLAPATSRAAAGGLADDSHAAFPTDDATLDGGSYHLSLDGKGNDPYPTALSIGRVAAAFPIDNVTAARVSAGIPSGVPAGSRDAGAYALAPGQDMDPYALGQDMDPYALALDRDTY